MCLDRLVRSDSGQSHDRLCSGDSSDMVKKLLRLLRGDAEPRVVGNWLT
jgi:hypothetical protein